MSNAPMGPLGPLPGGERLAPAELSERELLPARERPFRDEAEPELKYEIAVRMGPYARCMACGYLPHHRVDLMSRPECPKCRKIGTITRWKRWAPAMVVMDALANDWARRVCDSLGLIWPVVKGGHDAA